MSFRNTGRDGPDVILVDRMCLTTDYLARQLASRGVRVHLFTPSRRWPPPVLQPAYPYKSLLRGPLGNQPSEELAALVERVNPACIIPVTEAALYWLWNQPAQIQERCLPNVSPEHRPLLLDRALLLEKAAGWGVATPDAIPLNSHDDCLTAIATGLPLIVKSGQSVASEGVALCGTADEVIRAFDKFSCRAISVTAQRYYFGPTYLAGALFVHGEAAHFYAGEKTGVWPPLIGYSYQIQSAAEPYLSILKQDAETVCKNLEWTGLASFDFVLDKDHKFRFVDFNPRLWGAAGALSSAKVDLYGGIDRLIRGSDVGPPTRSIPDITHRVFPKYTLESSEMSMWRRLMGLRHAPLDAPFLAASELAYKTALKAEQRWKRRAQESIPG
ncbi:hypothetical protein EAS64_38975 [Trebonia kvetii]|uniref:ATP-grasp domain-containing protein n=1 Tax=Trebonia kvetii TaxID=2480626 RepID=A0A6P2BLW9_9ACTN|nr:hypothetical protein [Trebonia kvetii]TVZ00059.1 hypothetical protein EAS64_38975 [Trebonia kvetii]